MTIHEAITHARQLSGMTRQELAQAIGYTGQTAGSSIGRYETGERTPGSELIERIGDATQCKIEYDPDDGWSATKK